MRTLRHVCADRGARLSCDVMNKRQIAPCNNDQIKIFIGPLLSLHKYMAVVIRRLICGQSSQISRTLCLPDRAFGSTLNLYRRSLVTSSYNMGADTASAYRANGDNGDDGSTEGELNQWKHRAPYRVHSSNDGFKTRYNAQCHCGKVRYQLSREKPLDAKFCHCTTCQRLHGKSDMSRFECLLELHDQFPNQVKYDADVYDRRSLSVVCYLPQG